MSSDHAVAQSRHRASVAEHQSHGWTPAVRRPTPNYVPAPTVVPTSAVVTTPTRTDNVDLAKAELVLAFLRAVNGNSAR